MKASYALVFVREDDGRVRCERIDHSQLKGGHTFESEVSSRFDERETLVIEDWRLGTNAADEEIARFKSQSA